MSATLLALGLVLTAAGDSRSEKSDSPRKPNPFAPSLNQLTDEEEKALDAVIDRFIDYDTGKLRGQEGVKALREFQKLGPDAIPALIRGINRAAAINHSCPVTVIAEKLKRLLAASKDTKLMQFVRDEVGSGVGPTRHAGVLQDLRVAVMLHRNALVRAGYRDGTPPEKPLRFRSTSDLLEASGKERGQRLKAVLYELASRPGDEPIAALGVAAGNYDKTVQTYARNLLVQNLARQKPDTIKEKLKDEKAEVRAAAIKATLARNLPHVGELIDMLDDDNEAVRGVAQQTLVRYARGTNYGPKKGASQEERQKAMERWRSWWARQGGR